MKPILLPLAVASLLAIVAAPAAARAPAAESPIQPGYWESTNRILSPIRTKKVERRCLTPADIDNSSPGRATATTTAPTPTRRSRTG